MTTSSTALSQPVKQFSIFLQNRVGALLEMVRIMNEAGVEVVGLSVQDSVDATVVRVIVSDPEALELIFHVIGMVYTLLDTLVVELPEGSSGLAECLSHLHVAETNVNFSYPLLSRPGLHPALAIHVEDAEVAVSVLNGAGFRLLCQDDLSR